MRKAFICLFCAAFLLSSAADLFAVDEDTYVRFAADSVIIAHRVKGDPNAAEIWASEIRSKYPDLPTQDIQAFEARLKNDTALRDRVHNKVLENVRARGYKASIVDLGGGEAAIQIES